MIIELSKKKLIIISLTLVISLIGLISITQINFLDKQSFYYVSFLRQIVGLVCLICLPGTLILRILKIGEISNTEKLIYSVGLSISIIMIVGSIINEIYPLIGFSKPISLWSLLMTFSGINLILLVIIYTDKKEHNYTKKIQLDFKELHNLIYVLLPILAIIGARYLWDYNNKLITLTLIIIIAVISIAAIADKVIKKPTYTLLVYMIALALLLHNTMVSPYPLRINADGEYLYQQLVIKNGFWDYKVPTSANSALSIVTLGPILSIILNVDVFYLFKFIYPLIFSLVPLTAYIIYSKQINEKCSFISTLFFMFFFSFYTEAILLRRQEISFLYFSSIILLMIDQNIDLFKKNILSTIFLISLVVSHYTMSAICLILFTFTYLIDRFIVPKISINILKKQKTTVELKSVDDDKIFNKYLNSNKFSNSYLILLVVLLISWVMYIGSSHVFNNIILLGQYIYSEFFIQSNKSKYLSSAFGEGILEHHAVAVIYAILQYFSQLCIAIGSVGIIVSPSKFKKSYISLVIAALIILLIVVVAPHLSIAISIFRIYLILLIILSPLCVIGGHILWIQIKKLLFSLSDNICRTKCYKINKYKTNQLFIFIFVLIFLIPYFLFNVGFVFEIGNYNKDPIPIPKSLSLNSKLNSGYYTEQEVTAAIKASKIKNQNSPIYGDMFIGYDLISGWDNNSQMLLNTSIEEKSYLFLRKWNLITGNISIISSDYKKQEDISIDKYFVKNRPKIYENGNSTIYGFIYT